MNRAELHPYLILLQRLAESLAPATDTDHLLAQFDELAADLSDGELLAVHLMDGERARMPEAHARRLVSRFGPRTDHDTLVSAWLTSNRAEIRAQGATALMPLRSRDRLLGVLIADRRDAGGVFGETDLPILAALAGMVAHALATGHQHNAAERLVVEALRRPLNDPRLAVIGDAAGLRAALATLDATGMADSPLIISGPPGVGKTLFARLAHQRSRRAAMPCQVLACAGLEAETLTARLLGRADSTSGRFHPGFAELAHGGTLVLDDVGELPETIQNALISLLDQHELLRPGSHQPIAIDVRLIITSDECLPQRLQPRLGQRLTAHAHLPGLDQRRDDLDRLTDHFLAEWSLRFGTTRRHLSTRARLAVQTRPWPGHIRELRATLELAAARAAGPVVTELDLAPPTNARTPDANEPRLGSLEDVEARHLQLVLAHVQGNKSQAAEILGIGRNTLYAKLKQYGIDG